MSKIAKNFKKLIFIILIFNYKNIFTAALTQNDKYYNFLLSWYKTYFLKMKNYEEIVKQCYTNACIIKNTKVKTRNNSPQGSLLGFIRHLNDKQMIEFENTWKEALDIRFSKKIIIKK